MTQRKKWGRVNPSPNEYIVQLRRGRIVAHGPGLSIFAWPADSWAVVPTSIQRVAFVADQVTAEKVGVEVRGVAVFRVADPLLAFRVLDFSGPQPMANVAEILRDMFVGAARRLVANMTVEACMTRRKEEIALELVREIRPVVSGTGRPQDSTDQGWGLVVDTIEIQDVKILSEAVFQHLQAPYRASIEMGARQSNVARDREVHLREVEANHARLEADQRLESRRQEVSEASRLAAIERDEGVRVAQCNSDRRIALLEHALAEERTTQSSALRRQQIDAELAILEDSTLIERRRGELAAELAGLSREVDNQVSDARIRHDYVKDVLPALAAAMAQNVGSVHITQIDGGDGTNGQLGMMLAQLAALVRSPSL